MASVNKVILMGNLGKDPEVRFMPNGDAVCNFSIATTDNWKDKNGEKQERTEWHNIVMYRKLAALQGVRETVVLADEGMVILKVDMQQGWDEAAVVRLIGE